MKHTVRTPDGRRLAVRVEGAEDGEAVLCHMGTPDDALLFPAFVEKLESLGGRCLIYARPGYGDSDRQPGRRVADCAADVSAIADAFDVESFLTIGWSGGGPHALATAALLPERVRAVATIASIAPRRAEGLDWLGGMAKENLAEFAAAEAGDEELQAYLEREAKVYGAATADDIRESMGDLPSPADRLALEDREYAKFGAESMRGSVKNGIWGWFDDDMASMRDWGFDLAGIECPVTLWQGGDDRYVPPAHGKWLAEAIPGATLCLRPEAGHTSVTYKHFAEILDRLLAQVRRGGCR